MIRFLIRVVIFFASAAIGLLVTAVALDNFHLHLDGFLIAVAVFALLQSILSPFIARVAAKNATALLGGAGLISTFAALLVATLFTSALSIRGGVITWVAATVIVWAVTAAATLFLPVIMLKRSADEHHRKTR
jgi:Na+/melibiose symporter-like transporter